MGAPGQTDGSDEPELDEIKVNLGRRLKDLRNERGMSARALAEASGVSGGFLSQVENGRVMPSVGTLIKLATALGTRVGDLFDQVSPGGRVIRRDDRPAYPLKEQGVNDAFLSSDPSGEVEVLHSTIEPGAGTGEELYTHGTRVEVVYVESGSITIRLDTEEIELDKGDSITFSGETPHGAVNRGTEPAELIWIAAPARY
jgi:transcriptional regulator with XRE-family HTH domain